MSQAFFENPIVNSPYEEPTFHHQLDPDGKPTNALPLRGRRPSSLYSPMPKTTRGGNQQAELGFEDDAVRALDPHGIINEIRKHVASWRTLPNPNDWGVTPVTQRLLRHWRDPASFDGIRPFFCQLEAAETVIWLAEVARRNPRYKTIWSHIEAGNEIANPELLRQALKMATGAGKTTADGMADIELGPDCEQFAVHAQFPRYRPWHHDQGPPPRAPARRP